ncbi:MAG: carbon starvation protein CstA [delta proteobacterium ML8_F1]|nr:MAG: carbon starvation protein CstA [delta proteobacterium ML8_F1]
MNSLYLIIFVIIAFLAAYTTYGAWLSKQWGLDPQRKTPAHTQTDGVDFVPAKAPVLLGHHFASISGAGPIIGPITAAMFGWLPVLLWIVIGSVFFGGVHDMGSLFASVRHDGKSIGEVIGETMGRKGKKLFAVFAWLTLILIIAAFVNIVSLSFVATPSAATASMLFIFLAVAFGLMVYKGGMNLTMGTIIGVVLMIAIIWAGVRFPLLLSVQTWMIILLLYIFIASVTPVWILLQPRDYLNSFILYAMLAGGILGLVFLRPEIQLPAFTSFKVGNNFMFPILFITVACGAISGFHSLVGSGTTSKQLDNESDIQLIGYGGMLIEGVLATLAILSAAYISQGRLTELMGTGGALNVFADGLGTFIASMGISFSIAKTFVTLSISAFALTTLDTATRLARFIFQEFFEVDPTGDVSTSNLTNLMSDKFVATTITVVISGALAFNGWSSIWPLFGSANQLLAALTLLTLALWLKKEGKNYTMAVIPIVFMFTVTLLALVLLMFANLSNPVLLFFPIALFILAVILIFEAKNALTPTLLESNEKIK